MKQDFSVIFRDGIALDTQDVLAYDGPVLRRFSDGFGPKLPSSAPELLLLAQLSIA